MSDLVERLRDDNTIGCNDDGTTRNMVLCSDAADRIEHLEAVIRVGEIFLDKCNSAWSCGEPTHRVRTMLDAADNFRAALNELDN